MVLVLEAKYKKTLLHYEFDGYNKTDLKKKLKKMRQKSGIHAVLDWKIIKSCGSPIRNDQAVD